jgi:Relaxase/Mobilisation nuclease domain.
MVPDVAKAGRSFNGAFAYYLHDKRQDEAAAHPDTAERVAWTETRNLATANPTTAKRIMIETARAADELKAAAGVKATGRKSTAHVYAYALAWHPDEASGLDRAEMVRAVDASLKVLGAENHQAVIVCHREKSHPHVHVILNRVDPETGKMLSTSNDFRKLSDWANSYERERGRIVTPLREEKRQTRESFQQAAARPAPQPPAQRPKAVPKAPSEAALLKALTDAQKARHAAAWPALSEKNKAERAAIFATYGEQIKAASARHKELARPLWAQHFRQERMDAAAFAARERETFGRIANALAAAKHQMATGQAPERGLLSLTFANVLNSHSRGEAFTAQQETKRGEVARQLRSALDAEVAGLKAARSVALDRQREAFTVERQDLIDRQAAEKAKNREAWRQVYSRRGKEPEPRARQQAATPLEREPVKEDFEKAKRLAEANLAPHPTERRFVSSPAPTPAPAGAPPIPARAVQDVPQKPEPIMPEVSAAPSRDWPKAATPAQPAPEAKVGVTDWSAKYKLTDAQRAAADHPKQRPDGPKMKQ